MSLLQISTGSVAHGSFDRVTPVCRHQQARFSTALAKSPVVSLCWKGPVSQRKFALRVAADGAPTTTGAGVVTDADFEELVLKSPVLVLVDFWAPWCGPCRMVAPLIDEIAAEYGGRVRALKLNTDESPGIATEYGIRSIPTVMVFKNGVKMDTIIGAVPKATLLQTVEKYMK